MNLEEFFQKSLDEDPGNYALRLIFADWLDSIKDSRADAYRWLGYKQRRPLSKWRADRSGWDWFEDSEMSNVYDISDGILPISRSWMDNLNLYLPFATRREAEEAFAKHYPKLKSHFPEKFHIPRAYR